MSRLYYSDVFGIGALVRSGLAVFFTLAVSGTSEAQETTPSPPQQVSPALPPETKAAEPASESSSCKGLLGDWRLGPTVQVGFPHIINYGLDFLWKDTLSGGFATGKFEREIKDVTAEIANWDFRLRYHPFEGSFFLGLAYGHQEIMARAKKNLEIKDSTTGITYTVPTSAQIVLSSNYLTPHIGWFAMWDSGFTLGFELGAQIPMGVKTEKDVGFENVSPTHEALVKQQRVYKDMEKDVDDTGEQYGKMVLPYITLLRLGWLL